MEIIKRYQEQEFDDMLNTDTGDPDTEKKEESPILPQWIFPDTWRPNPGKKERAGYTKNKARGQSKTRRKMAKASRRQNR